MIDWPNVATNLIAAGGGGAAVAYAIFKGLGAKWIDNRFAKQLEESRQDHVTQIEHLRFKIAGLLDRSSKLNQREFEVLPDIWEKCDGAYGAASYLLNPWRSSPDFAGLGERQFEEIVESLDIPSFRKDEMKVATPNERQSIYGEAMRWSELNRAKTAARDFSAALSRGSIYLHPDTHDKLKEFEVRLIAGIQDREFNMQYPRQRGEPSREDGAERLLATNGMTWFNELGDYLRNRYWGDERVSLSTGIIQ